MPSAATWPRALYVIEMADGCDGMETDRRAGVQVAKGIEALFIIGTVSEMGIRRYGICVSVANDCPLTHRRARSKIRARIVRQVESLGTIFWKTQEQ